MIIGVIGQGYVGRTFSERAVMVGHEVIGIEIDPNKNSNLKKLNYEIFPDYSPVSKCEVIVIAVPTPLDDDGKPDVAILSKVCREIKPLLRRKTLIVNESTSYPGTLRNLILRILGDDFLFATAPERIDPGNADWTISNTPRVIGAITEEALSLAKKLYETISNSVHVVASPEIAEATKLLENTFRLVNITLINQLSVLFDDLDIPINETINAAMTKPFGFMPFFPSVGIGGHCIPIDPVYLSSASTNSGNMISLIDKSIEFNRSLPKIWAQRIFQRLKRDARSQIQVVGISYKAGVSDIRESASIRLIHELRKLGISVIWHDDLVKNWNEELSSPISKVDLGIITVRHPGVDFRTWTINKIPFLDLSPGLNRIFQD